MVVPPKPAEIVVSTPPRIASTVTSDESVDTKSVTSDSVNGVTCVASCKRSNSGVSWDGMTATPPLAAAGPLV